MSASVTTPTRKLGELCEVITKGTTPTTLGFQYVSEGVPFVRATNLGQKFVDYKSDVLYVDPATDQALQRSRIAAGDVLLAIAGTIGRSSVVPDDAPAMNCNQAVCIIRPSPEIDRFFLNHWLGSRGAVDQIAGSTVTGVISNLSLGQVRALSIPLPRLPEQRRIAAILDKADALRAKRREAIAKLDQLLQSVFLDMFGDPVGNPKGWDKVRMADLMVITRGGSPRPIEKFLGGAHHWVKIGDATKGDDVYISDTKEKIISEGLNKTTHLPAGSLIFANCGVSLGFARILKIDGCIHDGWLAFQKIDATRLNQLFLLKALNSITAHFRAMAPDGTQPNLNTGLMKAFELIVPPLRLQQKFAGIIESVRATKLSFLEAEGRTQRLFSSIQNAAFNGRL